MIRIDLPGKMTCDQGGCTAANPVAFVLQGAGGFAFKPESQLWQIALDRSNGVFVTRCPAHALKVAAPPPIIGGH